jgi:hypothetical protein
LPGTTKIYSGLEPTSLWIQLHQQRPIRLFQPWIMATCSQFFAPLKQIDASYPQGIFQNRLAPGFSMARHPVLA